MRKWYARRKYLDAKLLNSPVTTTQCDFGPTQVVLNRSRSDFEKRSSLLGVQRYYRIHLRRPARRNIAGHKRYAGQQQHNEAKGKRVGRAYAIQQAVH